MRNEKGEIEIDDGMIRVVRRWKNEGRKKQACKNLAARSIRKMLLAGGASEDRIQKEIQDSNKAIDIIWKQLSV